MNDRDILLGLLASLTLCDHIGDVANAADLTLRLPGYSKEERSELFGDDGMRSAWFEERGIPGLSELGERGQ